MCRSGQDWGGEGKSITSSENSMSKGPVVGKVLVMTMIASIDRPLTTYKTLS